MKTKTYDDWRALGYQVMKRQKASLDSMRALGAGDGANFLVDRDNDFHADFYKWSDVGVMLEVVKA